VEAADADVAIAVSAMAKAKVVRERRSISFSLTGIPRLASVFDPKSTVPVVSGGRRPPEL
jgi:hypothetical protein